MEPSGGLAFAPEPTPVSPSHDLPAQGVPVTLSPPDDPCEADQEGPPVTSKRKRKRRKRRKGLLPPLGLDYAAAAVQASEVGHVDLVNREALQQLVREESGKRICKTQEIRNSTGTTQERWKTAAEAELTSKKEQKGAYQESTQQELAQQ